MKKCYQADCSKHGTEFCYTHWYCKIHARLRQMLSACRHDGKSVPSIELLTQMANAAVASKMRCRICRRKMNWMSREGRSTCASLQHNRDGTFEIICIRCNLRHGRLPGDLYYAIPVGHKWCNGCKKVLPLDDFYPSRVSVQGVMSRCKKCASKIARAWVKKNRKRASDYERERVRRKKCK